MATADLAATISTAQFDFSPDYSVVIPATACTLQGFRDWATSDDFPERGQISFIQQKIWVDMSPEIDSTHNYIKTEIVIVVGGLVKTEKLGRFLSDGILLTNQTGNVSNEPDAMFSSKETIASGRIRRVPREDLPDGCKELEGTPDWVLEVVSKSSVHKDKTTLRRAYFAAGIPEYWLIDVRKEQLAFNILVRGTDAYVDAPLADGWQQSPVFNRAFKLDRTVDELGDWVYTLSMRDLS